MSTVMFEEVTTKLVAELVVTRDSSRSGSGVCVC